MPELAAVFIATVIANIVSSLILDLLHTALQKWHQGQISFLKNQKPRSFLRCFTLGFSFVMRKCHHCCSSLSLKESWLNRISKLSLMQHTWLKQSSGCFVVLDYNFKRRERVLCLNCLNDYKHYHKTDCTEKRIYCRRYCNTIILRIPFLDGLLLWLKLYSLPQF